MSSRGLIRPLTYILRLPLVLQGEVLHVHDGPPGHRLHLVALRLPVLVLLDQLVVQRLPGVRQPAALDALHAKGGVGQAILHLVGVCGGAKVSRYYSLLCHFLFFFSPPSVPHMLANTTQSLFTAANSNTCWAGPAHLAGIYMNKSAKCN